MAEHKTKMIPYRVDYHCDTCSGYVVRDKEAGVLASNPPKYPHKCIECGEGYRFPVSYPLIVHLPESVDVAQ